VGKEGVKEGLGGLGWGLTFYQPGLIAREKMGSLGPGGSIKD